MNSGTASLITLKNNLSSVTVDLFGGAIINFHLINSDVNPLSFAFSKEQMPENNKAGAPYQGHFLCLGRWGLPSDGETKAGIPNHGEVANILWAATEINGNTAYMHTIANLEGLQVNRKMILDNNSPVFGVTETVTNKNPIGRLYNMVQHPTLAAPFLDNATIIDCNASVGFDQALYKNVLDNILHWPNAKDKLGNSFNLSNSLAPYNAVFSFVVSSNDKYGWISAYSPTHQLLIGYIWKRSDYPWIHLWQYWEQDKIKYRGVEFGTAAIHQPFKEILDTATNLLGEKTFAYIDAGESITKKYFSFIYKTAPGYTGVEEIRIVNETIQIKAKANGAEINFKLTPALLNELSK